MALKAPEFSKVSGSVSPFQMKIWLGLSFVGTTLMWSNLFKNI